MRPKLEILSFCNLASVVCTFSRATHGTKHVDGNGRHWETLEDIGRRCETLGTLRDVGRGRETMDDGWWLMDGG